MIGFKGVISNNDSSKLDSLFSNMNPIINVNKNNTYNYANKDLRLEITNNQDAKSFIYKKTFRLEVRSTMWSEEHLG